MASLYVGLLPFSLLKLTGRSMSEGLIFGFSLTHITGEGSYQSQRNMSSQAKGV